MMAYIIYHTHASVLTVRIIRTRKINILELTIRACTCVPTCSQRCEQNSITALQPLPGTADGYGTVELSRISYMRRCALTASQYASQYSGIIHTLKVS